MDSPDRVEITGVDTSVIALWLGHESIEATNVYLVPRVLRQTGEDRLVCC